VVRPAAPANLRARRFGDSVALAWNPVAGASIYLVHIASAAAGPYTIAGTRATPAYTVSNLDARTRYYFRVFAGNGASWSPVSPTLVVPGLVPPTAPTNLRAYRSGSSVALAWNPVAGAENYIVYVASSAIGPYTIAGTRSTPGYTVSNLEARARYYFRVFAGNGAGWSSVSPTLVVPGLVPPAAPVDLRAYRSGASVALAWDPVPGAENYIVYVASSAIGPYTIAGTRSTPGYTVSNLDIRTRYYFRVFAGNGAGWSPASTTLGVSQYPDAPENLRARRWADNISLAWDAVPGASRYVIYMATSSAGPYTKLSVWPRASYTAGGVRPTSRYYFRVYAGNVAGWSPPTQLVVQPVVTDPNAVPARNPGAPPVGLLGDSVLAGLNDLGPNWGNLSAQNDVVANTRICRRLIDVTCDGRGDPSALAILQGGTIRGDVLIIGVTNSEWATVFGSAVDQTMAQARALGFQRVIWMTTNRPGSNSAQVNTILRQRAASNPSMQIADWASYSAGHPEWFWADGVHLRTTAGKLALANFLAAHVATATP
jgi:hypothetical protein